MATSTPAANRATIEIPHTPTKAARHRSRCHDLSPGLEDDITDLDSSAIQPLRDTRRLTCPLCLDSTPDFVFTLCGHQLCAYCAAQLIMRQRTISVTADLNVMRATFVDAACPICRDAICTEAINAQYNMLSNCYCIPASELYEVIDPSRSLLPAICRLCGHKSMSRREHIIHILDACDKIKTQCTLCKFEVSRDVGAHIRSCVGIPCKHNISCVFRSTKPRVLSHRRLVQLAELCDRRLLMFPEDGMALEFMRCVNETVDDLLESRDEEFIDDEEEIEMF